MTKPVMERTDCCIIIVTFNAKKWIEKCLKSLLSSNYKIDIIIVDNNSSDETINLINHITEPKKLFESKENLGFGKANNVGIEYAFKEGYEYFFLLNQDAYLEKNCIGFLIESMRANPEVGIISPIHLNGKGDDLDYGFKAGIKSKKFVNNFYQSSWSQTVYQVRFVNAAAWMLCRQTIEKVGLFHPLFFHYGEDKNYASRTKYTGLKIAIDRRASVRHDRENRGYNALISDPHRNHTREAWQILLNPQNSKGYVILLIMAITNMLVITKGWQLVKRVQFLRENIKAFKSKYSEMKEYGRLYNPYSGSSK